MSPESLRRNSTDVWAGAGSLERTDEERGTKKEGAYSSGSNARLLSSCCTCVSVSQKILYVVVLVEYCTFVIAIPHYFST